MLDPEIELFPQSSPTISSISSSDFDTESTGSFFHDRSTSLGTLMGVSFPTISLRGSSLRENNTTTANGGATNSSGGGGGKKSKKKKKKKKKVMRKVVVVDSSSTDNKRRRWWKLCRDEETRPSSLADFLEVERKFGDDGVFYSETAELEGIVHHHHHHEDHHSSGVNGNGRLLFADGRVLPPSSSAASQAVAAVAAPPITEILCRFPVLLSGICSGGGPPGRGGV